MVYSTASFLGHDALMLFYALENGQSAVYPSFLELSRLCLGFTRANYEPIVLPSGFLERVPKEDRTIFEESVAAYNRRIPPGAAELVARIQTIESTVNSIIAQGRAPREQERRLIAGMLHELTSSGDR